MLLLQTLVLLTTAVVGSTPIHQRLEELWLVNPALFKLTLSNSTLLEAFTNTI